MTIVTINRSPAWGDMAVGAVLDLPPALADPLIASGEAVPTPAATPTQASPYGEGSGTGTISTYTEAQLDAMEIAGTLTPYARYVASDTEVEYRATDAFTLVTLEEEIEALGYVAGYSVADTEKLAGVPSGIAAAVLAEAELSRPLVLPVTPITQNFVWIIGGGAALACSDNGAGKTRIANGAAHGINSGGSQVGDYIYVASFAGHGTGGFYPLLAYVDANNFDIDYAWNASRTTASVQATTSGDVPVLTFTVPGGLMGIWGRVEINLRMYAEGVYGDGAATLNRMMYMRTGTTSAGTLLAEGTSAQQRVFMFEWGFSNIGATNSQLFENTVGTGFASAAFQSLDTTADQTFTVWYEQADEASAARTLIVLRSVIRIFPQAA